MIRPRSKECCPVTFPPLRELSYAGKGPSSTSPTAFVVIAAVPKRWRRRPFCAPTVRSASGARMRSSPPGFSRSRPISIDRKSAAFPRELFRSTTSPNLATTAPLTEASSTAIRIAPYGGPWPYSLASSC